MRSSCANLKPSSRSAASRPSAKSLPAKPSIIAPHWMALAPVITMPISIKLATCRNIKWKPSPITKAIQATTCSFLFRKSSKVFQNSASIIASPLIPRVGAFIQNTSQRKWVFTKIPIPTLGASRWNSGVPRGSSWTQDCTIKNGHAKRPLIIF